jgi:hypothetical protein
MEDLLKLSDLREKGLLTEEEYEEQKQLIMPVAESSTALTKPGTADDLEQRATTAPELPAMARHMTRRETKASITRQKQEHKKVKAEAEFAVGENYLSGEF